MQLKIVTTLLGVAIATPVLAGDDPVLSALLREGETTKDGTIGTLDSPATNHVGGYAVGTQVDGVETIWGSATAGPGGILRQQGTIDNYEQGSFESFIGLADDGTVAYSPSCVNLNNGATGLDGVWFGDDVVWIEEEEATQFPGFWYSFGSRPGCTSDGPYGIGGMTDTQGGSTDFRALFIGLPAVSALTAGDVVPNVPFPIAGGGSLSFDVRVAKDGVHWMIEANIDSGSSLNDATVINQDGGLVLGGTLVREGNAIPVSIGGILGENWDNFDYMGVTADGQYMFSGDSDGDTSMDEFVVVNGEIVLREGMFVDGFQLTGSAEAGHMNDNGDWAIVWDVLDDGQSVEALIVNGRLVAREGQDIDYDGDGNVDAGRFIDAFTGIAGMQVGAHDGNGFNVYGTADIDVDGTLVEVLYCVRLEDEGGCPCDFDANGFVDVDDLLFLLGAWGSPDADCTGDGTTNVDDLLDLLADWGEC